MTAPNTSLQDKVSPASSPKLIIASFETLDRSSHWLNELASFKNEGRALGLPVRILALRSTDPAVAAYLNAVPVFEPLPAFDVSADNFQTQLVIFAETAALEPFFSSLDAEDPEQQDVLYFPRGHPLLIRGIGLWLARRPPGKRPSVFFRIIGDELTDLNTGRYRPRATLYHLACSDLRTRAGQERVFFLVNSKAKARTVSRAFGRQPLMMQHHFGRPISDVKEVTPAKSNIYVHLNMRSGHVAVNLGEIVQRVVDVEPSVRFLVKIPAEFSTTIQHLKRRASAFVEIIDPEQSSADYFTNMARCSLVWLAYEAQPYKALTSGVFTEAASLGKPVIVPRDTWMAEKIDEGYGVGVRYDGSTPRAVADALLDALRNLDQLGGAARALAPRLGEETGCRRFIETMIAFSQNAPDTTPRYEIGDEIDFSSALDSRSFMRTGWGDSEAWGVWTIAHRAELELPVHAKTGDQLVLNALARAYLGKGKEPVRIRVSAASVQIAEWIFEAGRFRNSHNDVRWVTASLPLIDHSPGQMLNILFEVESPKSPLSEGQSTDPRMLGLGLSKLSLTLVT